MRCKNREILYVFLFFILFAVSHFLLVQYHMRNIAIDGKENKDTSNGMSNVKNTGLDLNNSVLKRKSKLSSNSKKHFQYQSLYYRNIAEPTLPRKEEAEYAVNTFYHKNSLNYTIFDLSNKPANQDRFEYFRGRCAFVMKQENFVEGVSHMHDDCVLSNEMAARRKNIQAKCNLGQKKKMSNEFEALNFLPVARQNSINVAPLIDTARLYVFKHRKLIWCPVFKAASTNWMSRIPGLTNFKQWQIKMLQKRFSQPNTLARYLVPSWAYSELKEFIKTQSPVSFLIVRHPYDRLLSAYRDKFENKKKFYHLKYGRFMIRQYRKRGIRRFGKAFYRSSETSDYQVHPHWKAARRNKNDATPTFWEFVKSIIDNKIFNEHWAPASSVCSICKIHYDFILKTENLSEEEAFMLRQLNMTNARSKYENLNPSKLSLKEKKGYFSMLNENEMRSLQDIYKDDFDNFEYDPNAFD